MGAWYDGERSIVILFLAAFAPELAALESDLNGALATVGIGLVEAALGTTRALEKQKPSHVVLVGTAGAYPSAGLAIGDVVVASRVLLAAPSGAMVPAMRTETTSDESFIAEGPRRVTVATTLTITTDDALARELERVTHAHVEHLEAFAVARACEQAGVPFTAVLGIANTVGARGREEWRKHHERAAAAACAVACARNRPGEPSPG